MISLLILVATSSATSCSAKNVHLVCEIGSGCVNGTCGVCTKNDQCNGQYACTEGVCKHKNLFPTSWQTWIGMISAFGISILGGATGMGGGSFVVPIYSLVNAFSTTNTIGLSQATILGNGLTSFIIGVVNRHPNRNRPRVYFDIVFVMVAPLLAGSFLGVFVAAVIPQYVIMLLLLAFLVYTLIKTVKRAYRTTKKENAERAKRPKKDSSIPALPSPSPSPAQSPLDLERPHISPTPKQSHSLNSAYISSSGEENPDAPHQTFNGVEMVEMNRDRTSPDLDHDHSVPILAHDETITDPHIETDPELVKKHASDAEVQKVERNSKYIPESTNPALQKIYKKERFPGLRKTLFIVICWILLFLVSIARGAKGAPSLFGIPHCSVVDWSVFAAYLVVSLLLTAFAGYIIMREQKKKTKLGYEITEGDVVWTVKTSVLYPLFCILAGFVAGLLGIGGAIVTSPVLMDMGVLVPVVTATTSALLFLTSSSSAAQFAVGGMLPWDYGICFFLLGLSGAVVGGLVNGLSVKYKRSSILIWLMALLFGLSTILAIYNGINNIAFLAKTGGSFGFHPMC
ncbi:putative sulfite exporter TauE/SafE [Blattamonas nauphoetae]|uniref:Sulfite exporter TauE/SafE n=1 Tax=Blattamonas nauphoetae TaxID=2049346 RepID=A0ABQ9X725_9EUKA|nr:putative sulfite exporter TauE/SafE [Blattamonas nauphoetae]